jgi:hypothetical protein
MWRAAMMEKLIPVNLGDHVVIRPGEELDSLVVHGKIESKTWNNFTQDYQYGIVVPGQNGEAHDEVIVYDCEIWGVLDHRTDH